MDGFYAFHVRRGRHRSVWTSEAQDPTARNNQNAHWGLVNAEDRCSAFIDLHVNSSSPLRYEGDRYSGASSQPHKALGKSRWHIGLNQEPISKQARKNWFTKCITSPQPCGHDTLRHTGSNARHCTKELSHTRARELAYVRTCNHEPIKHLDAYACTLATRIRQATDGCAHARAAFQKIDLTYFLTYPRQP